MSLFGSGKQPHSKKSKLISLEGSHVSGGKHSAANIAAAEKSHADPASAGKKGGKALSGKGAKGGRLGKKSTRRLIIAFLVLVLLGSTAFGLFRMFVKPPSADIDIDQFEVDDIASDPDQLNGLEPHVASSKKRKEDYFTMIIACTDEGKTRTDAMILMSFDVKNKTVNLMNIPRDTMSNVSRSVKKINGAYANGKLKQMYKELDMLLGIPIDRYVIFDFDGVAQMVEAIGGVTFNVPRNMNYDDPTQNLHIHLKKGEQKLSGSDAVKMLRFRKNNGGGGYARGDIERIELMQDFIKALAHQIITPSTLSKLPQLAKAVADNTDTDLKNGEMIWFGIQGLSMDLSSINTYTLPGKSKSVYEPGIGLYQSYWIPDKTELLTLINSSFNPYTSDITDIDTVGSDKTSTVKRTTASKTTAESGQSNSSSQSTSSEPATERRTTAGRTNEQTTASNEHYWSSMGAEPTTESRTTARHEEPTTESRTTARREEPTTEPRTTEPTTATPEPTTTDPSLENSPII